MTIPRNLSFLAEGASSTGVLNPTNGGTGLTTLTASYIPYGNGTGAFNSSSGLTFDGTNFATLGYASATSFRPTSSTIPTNGMYLPTTNTLGFATNSAERMRLFASGGVSIGNTTDPGATNLSVTGSLTLAGGTPLTTYTEGTCSLTVTSSAGTLTTASASATYTKIGRTVLITGTVTITNNGTGSGSLNIAGLPFTPTQAGCGVGRESVNNGKTCSFMISSGSTTANVYAYDNTYPVSTNSVIQFSISYTA
jgi:hypothetical protein